MRGSFIEPPCINLEKCGTLIAPPSMHHIQGAILDIPVVLPLLTSVAFMCCLFKHVYCELIKCPKIWIKGYRRAYRNILKKKKLCVTTQGYKGTSYRNICRTNGRDLTTQTGKSFRYISKGKSILFSILFIVCCVIYLTLSRYQVVTLLFYLLKKFIVVLHYGQNRHLMNA